MRNCVLQNSVIQNYFQICGKKSLRMMAEDTGIQLTRLFRILNGWEMKLSEYERFKTSIKRYNQDGSKEVGSVVDLAVMCQEILSHDGLEEIRFLMESRLTARRLQSQQ